MQRWKEAHSVIFNIIQYNVEYVTYTNSTQSKNNICASTSLFLNEMYNLPRDLNPGYISQTALRREWLLLLL